MLKGQKVLVKAHTEYQDLRCGAIITPMIAHSRTAFETKITNIFVEELEDENGDLVFVTTIEVSDGQLFDASLIEAID